MYEDVKFEMLHEQFEPMIFHIITKLRIYKNEKDFYQVGCIALWEASLRFDKEKGEFKSFAYSYMIGRMKMALSEEQKKQEKETQLDDISVLEKTTEDDYSAILTDAVIDRISRLLSPNQRKWLNAYYYYGNTPSEIAKDEGVSISAVKAWRRDTIAKLRMYFLDGGFNLKVER